MRQVLFMPCAQPPPLVVGADSTLRSMFANPPKSFFLHPSRRGLTAFQYSAFAMVVLAVLCVAGAREIAYTLSNAFGIAAGLITVVVAVFLVEMYRRSGLQCTLWVWMVLFMSVIQGSALLGRSANSRVGKALGLQELPAAKEPVDPQRNCMRLAACQASPVFSHHEMAREKIDACEACSARGKLFEGTWRDEEGVKVFAGYKCSERPMPVRECAGTPHATCPSTRDALELMGEPASSVDAVCRESGGRLCHVSRSADGTHSGYAGAVAFAGSSSGLGYPTAALCEKHSPGGTCVELPDCVASDTQAAANCYCDQYRTRRSKDPCEFLATKCDVKSPLYAEAKVRIAQQGVNVGDIVDAQDLRSLVTGIDAALGFA